MKGKKHNRVITAIARSLLFGTGGLLLCNTAFAAIVLIGNPNIQINHLTKNQLESIYLGKPVELSTGEQLQPFDQPDRSPLNVKFYKDLIGWTPSRVSAYWSSITFQGEGNAPPKVQDDDNAIAVVEGTPEAISYIDGSALSAAAGRVKVLYTLGQLEKPKSKVSAVHPTPKVKAPTVPPVKVKPVLPAQTIHKNPPKPKIDKKTQKKQAEEEVKAINASLLLNHHANAAAKPQQHAVFTGKTVWSVMALHFSLIGAYSQPAVQHQIAWYIQHKGALQEMFNNATPYIYYVYRQTRARKMPAEFALLPMVESGYNPGAYSTVGATGIWQMMPGTASSLGLDINWWYDARRDTLVSTQAALNYLDTLYGTFHNWLLAAAAYDAGVGSVQAAQAHNQKAGRSTLFWDLPLSRETKAYIPKLLALAAIIKDPARYGVKLPDIPNQPYFSAIHMNSQIDLIEAGRLAGVSPNVIRHLNPGMRRWATDPDGVYTLLVPSSTSKLFKANLAKVDGKEHTSWQYHEVRNGETLASIAKNYHTQVPFLERVNGLENDQIVPEEGLLVPLYLHRTYSSTIVGLNDNTEAQIAKTQNITAPENPKLPAQSLPAKSQVSSAPAAAKKQPPPSGNLKSLLGKIYGKSKH